MHDRRITDTYHDDEISLIDMWRTLVRHKKLIFLIWGLILDWAGRRGVDAGEVRLHHAHRDWGSGG